MGFFSGKNHVVVDGKKDLTSKQATASFVNPKSVAIPLKAMNSEKFDVLVEIGDQVKIGTLLATGLDKYKLPIYSSVSGTVTAIDAKYHISKRNAKHIVIENDFKDETVEAVGADFSRLSGAEVKELLKSFGVLGMSGSGFPTFEKFQSGASIEAIVINGMESEPYLTADEANMVESPEHLLASAHLLMKASDAQKAVVALPKDRTEVYNQLSKHLSKFENVEIKLLDNVYPAGWDKVLIQQIFGRTFELDASEVGIVCVNASTAIEFARSVETGLPLFERIVTLSGEGFLKPQNVRVRIGTALADVIEHIGGYAAEVNPKSARLVLGGPMKGQSMADDGLSIVAESNGFLSLLDVAVEEDPCSRCGDCVDHCPADLQPIQILHALQNKDKPLLKKLGATSCVECGICTFVCPSAINVMKSTSKAKLFASR